MPDEPEWEEAKQLLPKDRLAAAILAVLDEGMTQTAAAKHFGVARTLLNRKIKIVRVDRGLPPTARQERRLEEERRKRLEPKLASQVKRELGAEALSRIGLGALDDQVPRLPQDPVEFNERYFSGHLICVECGVHHETPNFHKEISRLMQNDDIEYGLILTPPFHAKTTIAQVWDTIYDLSWDRDFRTMIISDTRDFARLIVGQIKELLTDHSLYEGAAGNLIEEAGEFFERGKTWTDETVVVTGRTGSAKDPTIQALGYRGQIYGRRADKIKADDLASFQNQATPEAVKKMTDWLEGTVFTRAVHGKKRVTGTRVRPGDTYEGLMQRPGYHVVRYPAIEDESAGKMLWGDHFSYEKAVSVRESMDPAQWQLVYQNVDTLTHGVSFSAEAIDACRSEQRSVGHFDGSWFLIAGLDPAGAGPDSGFTAFVLLAVDAHTGRRYLVDAEAHKQMRAPQLKDKILEWSDRYPIYEWRVEANGVQRNLVQYNEDIIQPLAARGIKVSGHVTNQNKWDPQFGVETLAPLFGAKMIDIPMSAQGSDMEELIRQFKNFPLMPVSDLVMATWFAEIGAREIVTRPSLPLFSERTGHWPERIRKRRRLIDVHSGKVTPIPLSQQNSRFLTGADRRRLTVGRPTLYPDLVEGPGRNLKPLVNRDGFIDVGETEGDGDAPSGGTPSTG